VLKIEDSYILLFKQNLNLSSLTTYKIGGKSLGVFIFNNSFDLIRSLVYFSKRGIPYKIIGKGSNLLITDEELIEKVFIINKERYFFNYENKVLVNSGLELQYFIKKLIELNFDSYQKLAGIPASVGGCVFNNAGIPSIEISQYITKIYSFNRKKRKIEVIEINNKNKSNFFSYRNSFFKEEAFNNNFYDILYIEFEFNNKKPKEELLRIYNKTWEKRILSQPLNVPSCGSVFKNVLLNNNILRAWEIIDKLGFRGYTFNGAKVSEKHPNFIVNFNNAKFKDVYSIIQKIKNTAKLNNYNLDLEVEIIK
jgi:UDP-N-acetylmuramate dehydrogenase